MVNTGVMTAYFYVYSIEIGTHLKETSSILTDMPQSKESKHIIGDNQDIRTAGHYACINTVNWKMCLKNGGLSTVKVKKNPHIFCFMEKPP